MKKTIVILTGNPNSKNKFDAIAKSNGWWVWNINHLNVLSVASRQVGWDGNRDEKYYAFMEKFSSLVNEFWDFRKKYSIQMVEKFIKDERANLLVIHGCGKSIVAELQSLGANQVHIAEPSETRLDEYQFIIYDNEDFDKEIIELLNNNYIKT